MGQISSTTNLRRQANNEEFTCGRHSADVAISDANPTRSGRQSGNEGRSRRRSIRNSILDFVHAKSSSNTDADVTESRRRWRWHRRRSKRRDTRHAEPQVFDEVRDPSSPQLHDSTEIPEPFGDVDTRGVPALNSFPQENHGRVNLTANGHITVPVPGEVSDNTQSVTSKGKEKLEGKECSVETSGDAVDDNTGHSLPSPEHTNSHLDPSAEAGSSTSDTVQDDAPHALVQTTHEIVQESPGSPAPTQSPARSFSNNNPLGRLLPSGTLIVVQGVVRNDSTASLTQDDPSSSLNDGTASVVSSAERNAPGSAEHNAAMVRANDDAVESSDSSSNGSEDLSTLFEGLPASSTPSSTEIGDNTSRRESTSAPGGADVLSALLSIVSVATAATAASLLSNPNGPPAPPSQSEPTRAPPDTSSSQEGSGIPSIARALASANPAAAAVLAQRDRERERGERERWRVRSIWEALRERLSASRGGRSSTGIETPSVASAAPSSSRAYGSSFVPEPPFSEPVRAFTLGSLQDEQSSDAQRPAPGRQSAEGDQETLSRAQRSRAGDGEELTSPGSFERFLVDLQSDLRLALTHPDPPPDVRRLGGSPEGEGSGYPNVSDAARTSPPLGAPSASPSTQQTAAEDPLHPSRHIAEGFTHRLPSSHLAGALENVRTSDSSNIQPSHASSAIPDTTSSENRNFMIQSRNASAAVSSASAGDASRSRINWWRMYRFPPTAPVESGQSEFAHSSARSNDSVRPIEMPVQDEPSVLHDATQQRVGALVPVIVVGLQLISSASRRGPVDSAGLPMEDRIGDDADGETPRRTGSHHSYMNNSDAPERARGIWPSRAARAFNRLRRRDNVSDPGHESSNTNSGSRTFFIYVYGGHYPPDHQILSGSGAIDTFDALWELADFLGQAKPAVVTDEEIEQSGLELYKAANLAAYASRGRVASNCLDRCLICLDDYDPNDDLRLLTCKHTFHKVCVDRWLKTGRNNCPACRSEGVKIENSAFGSPRI